MGHSRVVHSVSEGAATAVGPVMVFVVSNDPAVRDRVSGLVEAVGLPVEAFASIESWLASVPRRQRGCAVLDIGEHDPGRADQREELNEACSVIPAVALIDRGDIHGAVLALKLGVVDAIEKSVPDAMLIESITRAVAAAGDVSHNDR